MGEKISIGIIDDHVLFRQTVVDSLNAQQDMKVIFQCGRGEEVFQIINSGISLPDVFIIDISLPDIDGIELVKKIKNNILSNRKIIILSMYMLVELAMEMKRLNIKGYVLKEDAFYELLNSVRTVYMGNYYLSSSVKKRLRQEKNNIKVISPRLTSKEREIIRLISRGYTNIEIANKLYISVKTVEKYKTNIYQKTGCKNAPELIYYAMIKGLIPI